MTPKQLEEWFQKCHENLQPLDSSFFKAANAGAKVFFGPRTPLEIPGEKKSNRGASSRDISAEEVDKRRLECIKSLRIYDLNHEADMLQATHEDQPRIRKEYYK